MNELEFLSSVAGEENVLYRENLSKHVTFAIGGDCRAFVSPRSTDEIVEIINKLKEIGIPYFFLGRGSNLLVSSRGYSGVVLSLRKYFSSVSVNETILTAGGGALLSQAASVSFENGLSGMECIAGIPGTIGGAVKMNAGAYETEIEDLFLSAKILQEDGTVRTFTKEEMQFSYRHSVLDENNGIVLSLSLQLQKGDPEKIREKAKYFSDLRMEKQPLSLPSAGSTFKRPEGYIAAALIDQCGLKGYRIGDAMVSEKHAGFVVNMGHADSEDVKLLLSKVQEEVFRQKGIRLEPEVIFLGE